VLGSAFDFFLFCKNFTPKFVAQSCEQQISLWLGKPRMVILAGSAGSFASAKAFKHPAA
jgi:hypothetical protein